MSKKTDPTKKYEYPCEVRIPPKFRLLAAELGLASHVMVDCGEGSAVHHASVYREGEVGVPRAAIITGHGTSVDEAVAEAMTSLVIDGESVLRGADDRAIRCREDANDATLRLEKALIAQRRIVRAMEAVK